MRRMATGASRNLLILLLPQPPPMNRSIIFRDLVDPQTRIVISHEASIGMAPATYLHNLGGRGFTDIAFPAVHSFQAHDARIAAMTSIASESFSSVNIRFEFFGRLSEILNAEGQVARRAAVGLLLRIKPERQRKNHQHRGRKNYRAASHPHRSFRPSRSRNSSTRSISPKLMLSLGNFVR